jgi:hypothetical protein
MKNKFLHMLAIAAFTLSIASCEKMQGPKGDTGAAGAPGTTGATGPQGTPGEQGPAGNANVHSNLVTIFPGQWITSSPGFYFADASVPAITTDIATSGMVSVFMQNNVGSWIAVPFSDFSYYYGFIHGPGTVRFVVENSTGGTVAFFSNYVFKVVSIASSYRKSHPDTDWKDYYAVEKILKECTNDQANASNTIVKQQP